MLVFILLSANKLFMKTIKKFLMRTAINDGNLFLAKLNISQNIVRRSEPEEERGGSFSCNLLFCDQRDCSGVLNIAQVNRCQTRFRETYMEE